MGTGDVTKENQHVHPRPGPQLPSGVSVSSLEAKSEQEGSLGNLISSRHSLYSLFLSLLSEPGCVSLKELLESTTQRGLQAASLLLHLPNMLRDTTCCPETIRSEPATTLEVGKGNRRYREGKIL